MKRIAIVEDNPDNRLLATAILGDDFLIDEYETGMQALEGLQKNPPDLVLLDISLPEMDGKVVLSRIRQIESIAKLPVIALTAHAMTGDREMLLGLGFDDYVEKPILDEQILIDAINKLLL
ncbi:MAG: response regulator [bacterium]|nr:response regulator [bacterium]